MHRFALFLLRWKYVVVILSLALVVGVATGVKKVTKAKGYRIWFKKDDPNLALFDQLQKKYSRADNVFFIVAPKSGEVFTSETLSSVEWLTDQAWKIPHSTRVDSVTNFQNTEVQGDDLIVEDLVKNAKALSPQRIAKIKETALERPELVNNLISEKAHATAVNVMVTFPGKSNLEILESIKGARELKEKFAQKYPKHDLYLTGIVMRVNATSEMAGRDMKTLIPLMYVVLLIALGIILRTVTGVFATLFLVTLSIAGALGFAGYAGFPITSVSAMAPMMILTLAVADCIHFLVAYLKRLRSGESKNDAIAHALDFNFWPIVITSITTAIGFLSLNFSPSPPFGELGSIVASGVIFALFLSVIFLPAFLGILPEFKMRSKQAKFASEGGRFETALGKFVIRNQAPILKVSLVVTTCLIGFSFMNKIDDRWVKYFSKKVHFRVASDYADQNLTGIYDIQYSLESGSENGINNPKYLAQIDRFVDWLRSQPEVASVSTLTDIVKRLNQNMNEGNTDFYRLPETNKLVAQYLLLYELSLPYGMDLTTFISIDKSATRTIAKLRNMSTGELVAFDNRAKEWLRQNTQPEIKNIQSGSLSLGIAQLSGVIARNMLYCGLFALLLISILLMFIFKPFRMGALSIVPNLVPGGMAFGIWYLVNGEVSLALTIGLGVTLGIVVDDTIHFMFKYLRKRKEKGVSTEEAVLYAFQNVGRAMTVTTIVVVIGFAIVSRSLFALNQHVAIYTIMTVILALIVDLILLPALIMKLDKRKSKFEPADNPRVRPGLKTERKFQEIEVQIVKKGS